MHYPLNPPSLKFPESKPRPDPFQIQTRFRGKAIRPAVHIPCEGHNPHALSEHRALRHKTGKRANRPRTFKTKINRLRIKRPEQETDIRLLRWDAFLHVSAAASKAAF